MAVEVTTNNVDFSVENIMFECAEASEIFSVYPQMSSSGAVRKLPVRITGEEFQNTAFLHCVFGKKAPVPAVWISPFVIACTPPEHSDGTVPLRVVMTDSNISTAPLNFTYHSPISVNKVWPQQGSVFGGSLVRVEGVNFISTSDILCRFGFRDVYAQYVDSNTLLCVTPAQESKGDVVVQITVNGVDFTDDGVLFHYSTPPQVLCKPV